MPNEYLSIPEAAAVLGISRIAVFKRVKKGRLAAIRIGRNWAVPASALALYGAGAPAANLPPSDASPDSERSDSDNGFEDMGWD